MRYWKFLIIGLVLFNLSSCKLRYKEGVHSVAFEETISGALSQSFIVTDAKLQISKQMFGSRLLVQVERTPSNLPSNAKDLDIYADIIGKNGLPYEQLLVLAGFQGTGLELTKTDFLSLKTGERIWLLFRIDSFRKSKLNVKPKLAEKIKIHSNK